MKPRMHVKAAPSGPKRGARGGKSLVAERYEICLLDCMICYYVTKREAALDRRREPSHAVAHQQPPGGARVKCPHRPQTACRNTDPLASPGPQHRVAELHPSALAAWAAQWGGAVVACCGTAGLAAPDFTSWHAFLLATTHLGMPPCLPLVAPCRCSRRWRAPTWTSTCSSHQTTWPACMRT
jgi:hypothetical protein